MEKGFTIGDYYVTKTIGVGGFSKVKLAEHKVTHETFAVKIFNKAKLSSKPGLMEKIHREISLMKIFDHPHIIKLYDVFESSRRLFIVLEYEPNGELFNYIVSQQTHPIEEAMRIFRQIIYGVDFLHSYSICHRDLKPENILLDENFNVKIADFGFAKWLKNSTTATPCGSPHYAAPEVVKGIPYNSKKTDIWSCGVILYALLCGRLPFNDPNFKTLLNKVKAAEYVMPDFPEDIQDLIRHMLTIDPEKRYSIEQVKHHKAFSIGLPRHFTPPLPFPMPELNPEIEALGMPLEVRETLKQIGFDDKEIDESLASKGPNSAKRFWAILTQELTCQSLPWCITKSNEQSEEETKFDFIPFREGSLNKFKEPFFGSKSYENYCESFDSPGASVGPAPWVPEGMQIPKSENEDIVVIRDVIPEVAAAELQKVLNYHSIDWLFPDDHTLFAKFKETYFMITIASCSPETCQVTFSLLSGQFEVFTNYVDVICSSIGAQKIDY